MEKASPRKTIRTPREIEIDITNRCNLRCKYCYHFTSAGDVARDLPLEEWLRFFDELGRCGVMKVVLCGGEPFLREDLPDLIGGIVRNRMRFAILTNGTLIREDVALFLAGTKRCEYVQVSIDGATPPAHESVRGDGTLQRAIDGLRVLQRCGVAPEVRVTVHRNNLHDLENVARLLLEELGLSSFSTNSASYMGLCRQNKSDVELSVEEYSVAMDKLLRLHARYPGRISASAGPLAAALNWPAIKAASEGKPIAVRRGGTLNSCGGVFQKLAVRADGVITPCTLLGHIELGRINQDELASLWLSHPELVRLRERKATPLSNFAHCRECAFMPYCAGGCPANAFNAFGTDDRPTTEFCLREFLSAGGRLPRTDEPADREKEMAAG